jgi:hypothetical protein
VFDKKLGAGIAESGGMDEVADAASERAEPLAEVEAGGFHLALPMARLRSFPKSFSARMTSASSNLHQRPSLKAGMRLFRAQSSTVYFATPRRLAISVASIISRPSYCWLFADPFSL